MHLMWFMLNYIFNSIKMMIIDNAVACIISLLLNNKILNIMICHCIQWAIQKKKKIIFFYIIKSANYNSQQRNEQKNHWTFTNFVKDAMWLRKILVEVYCIFVPKVGNCLSISIVTTMMMIINPHQMT